MTGPLAGTRVVELAGIGPVPFAAMQLADLGADVVRIDRPVTGPPAPVATDVVGRGRRSISLDLKESAGQEVARDLATSADVLLEGFRPGVMERLGLGPDELLVRNPRLVYGRASGWGQTGPYRLRPGHDINYIAISGALGLIGPAGQAPVPPLALVGDYGGGAMFLLTGVLAGLLHAARTGTGQVVDAAIVEGAAMLTASIHGRRAAGSWQDERGTNKNDTGSHFYNVYRTADDRYVTVGAMEPDFYRVLLERVGLSDDPDFAGQWDQQRWPSADPAVAALADRSRWPELRDRLAAVFATRTRAEWMAVFEGAETCFAPVLALAELGDDPQLRDRGSIASRDGVTQPAPTPRFSQTPAAAERPPVAPGAQSDEILAELGCTPEQIAALRSSGAVHGPRGVPA